MRRGASMSVFVVVVTSVGGVVSPVLADTPGPPTISSAGVDSRGRLCIVVDGAPGDLALVDLTPVNATAPGNAQLVPSYVTDRPVASNVNFAPGTVDPNLATVIVGGDRRACVVNSELGRVDLVIDPLAAVSGDAVSAAPAASERRVLDTRTSDRPAIGPDGRRCFAVTGQPGDLAIVNLTPVNATAPGNGQLVSSDTATTPLASNVNFGRATVDPNLATARIGADGRVCFLNSQHATVDLVADHLATIGAAAIRAEPDTSDRRVLDTRTTDRPAVDPGGRRCFPVIGQPGDLALVNLTPVDATAPGNGQLVSSDATVRP